MQDHLPDANREFFGFWAMPFNDAMKLTPVTPSTQLPCNPSLGLQAAG